MKKIHFVIGVIVGAILFGSISVISSNIIAMLSEQVIYVDGERVEMLAYHIGGNNFVRLRDIGRAVGFGVTFDETTGSVHIDSNSPYVDEYTIRQAREYYLILRGEFGRVRASQGHYYRFNNLNNVSYVGLDLSGINFERTDLIERLFENSLKERGFTLVLHPFEEFADYNMVRIRIFESEPQVGMSSWRVWEDGEFVLIQQHGMYKYVTINVGYGTLTNIVRTRFKLRYGIWVNI